MPIVHHFVLRFIQQAHAVINDLFALTFVTSHRNRKHAPFGNIHAAGKIPFAADHKAAINNSRASLRISDTCRDQGFRIGVPHIGLRALVVQREHPFVNTQVDGVPAG